MKRNDPYHWAITLRGKTRSKVVPFVGTLEAALDAADQEESAVAFTVVEFKVTRGAKANNKLTDAPNKGPSPER